MNWIQITAEFAQAPDDWSLVVAMLGELGCPNTLLNDNPPSITACIIDVPDSERTEGLIDLISTNLRDFGAIQITTEVIEEIDWVEHFKQHFKARRIGKRFVVAPTWDASAIEGDDLRIVLDPGLAFGTGDHPTTRMCLELMEEADLAGKKIADVGCGTGILSIGACLLGAAEVGAVDIEPQSVVVAFENMAQNNVRFNAVVGDGLHSLGEGIQWDGVISNIISATLINLSPQIALGTKPGGFWIVSGIIADNWNDVRKAAEKVGFDLDKQMQETDWVAARFVKRP